MRDSKRYMNIESMDNLLEGYGIRDELTLIDRIEDIERVFRSSRDYKGLVYWHRIRHGLSIDAIDGIDSYTTKSNITVELHHVIYLWDIVYCIGMDMLTKLSDGECYTIFDIASEVYRAHTEDIIPLIPLLKSDHEKYHADILDIPYDKIHGNVIAFLDRYKKYMNEYILDKYTEYIDSIGISI